jgi:hypothetical protein
MILSFRLVLTSNPGRLVGLTTTRRTIFPGIGHLIRSWNLMVRVLIRRFPLTPKILFPSFLRLLGHTFIDVLKIDIEGGEFDALTPFIAAHAEGVLPVGQMQLEIHAREGHERFDYFVKWWASLEAAGLRPFWTEANMVYINIVRGAAPELAEVCLSWSWRCGNVLTGCFSTRLLTSAAITRLLMKHLTKPELRLDRHPPPSTMAQPQL